MKQFAALVEFGGFAGDDIGELLDAVAERAN